MNCRNCGRENPADAAFCGACAASLAPEIRCPRCTRQNPAGQKFCHGCGGPLSGAAAPSAGERDRHAYTPKHLAERILTQRSALEGERKQVTVLFADVKGSTELAEALDPEEWHGLLDRFFAIAAEGVHRFEGTVNQYTGDGIMALFGAPIAHEDHAQRACYASLHLRDALRRYADELRLERGLALAVRMGLNSGEVVVGKIGDDLRMDYTAQGQVVNVAQRMEQLAESGRVYLAQQTADRVSGYFRLREVGPTRIKGLQDAVRVYELEDVGEFQGRFEVSLARGLSKFVGREREMAQLEAALERALRGGCQFVGIVAEPGTGKSRLVYEFSERCRRRGLRLITASCPPHGKNIPLGLAMAASRSQYDLLETDDRETARRKVAEVLSRADPALTQDVPFMLDFLGLAEPGSERAAMDPETRLREYLRINAILVPRTDYQVLVFEDLHWIDAASETITVQISRIDLPNRRLKLFTYRPEYRPAEADWPEYEEIRLRPFSVESTTELLRDLLGEDPSVKGLELLIQQRAAGNPFFVEEIVHSLTESGQLEGARGSRRLVRAIDDVEVPDSVQALLAARIDRLDEPAKAVLQAAAVVGLEFSVAAVEEVTAMSRRDLDAALHALARAEFVYQLAAYPEVEYAFKHPLTQQVAYDTQLREPRRRVHAKIARLLERQHQDKLDEKAGLIAYHWQEAGERVDAARWYARAASWLESRNVAEALRHWRLTRSLLGAGALSSESNKLAIAACTQILNMGWRHGMSEEEAARVFAEGTELAQASGDQRANVLLLDSFATYTGIRGHVDDYLECNRKALELAGGLDDSALTLGLQGQRMYPLWLAGRPREALALWAHSAQRALEPGFRELRNSAGFHLASVFTLVRAINLVCIGRFEEARISFEESLVLARQYSDVDYESFAQQWLSECCVELGDLDAALRHASHGLEAAEKHNNQYAGVWAHRFLGYVLIARERPLEACEDLERAIVAAREQGAALQGEADFLQLLAEAHLDAGQPARAQEECREAIAVAQRNGTPLYECDAHLVRARILLRAGASQPDAAREVAAALDRAQALLDQIGAESRRPRLLELRAELAHAQGDTAGRERFLREAHRSLIEMGATVRAQRVAEALAEL